MFILKSACSVSPAWLWWWFFLLTLTEQSWSALSFCGTASSSPAPVSGPEGLLLPTFPLPPSLPLRSLCSFPYRSHCLAVSALFPLSSVKLVVSSHHPDSSHSLDFQTKPQHISASSSSFYSPCLLWFGDACLLIVSEKMNITVFWIPWGMSSKAAWRREIFLPLWFTMTRALNLHRERMFKGFSF